MQPCYFDKRSVPTCGTTLFYYQLFSDMFRPDLLAIFRESSVMCDVCFNLSLRIFTSDWIVVAFTAVRIEVVPCRKKCDVSSNRGKLYHLKIIQKIPGQHTKKARHQGTTKNSHTGTAHIFWKVLMEKFKTFIMGNNGMLCVPWIVTEWLRHCTPRNIVCLRYIRVNTLYKRGNWWWWC